MAAWRDAPFYSDQERAALALAEAVTRIADTAHPVPGDLWAHVTAQFDEQRVAALIVAIATINVWNRLNVPTHQPPLAVRPTTAASALADATPVPRSDSNVPAGRPVERRRSQHRHLELATRPSLGAGI